MNGKEEKAARALKEWEATAVETKKEASEEAEEALEAEKKRKQIQKRKKKKNQKGRIKERRKIQIVQESDTAKREEVLEENKYNLNRQPVGALQRWYSRGDHHRGP